MKKVPKPYAKGRKNSLSIDPETHQRIAVEKARSGLQMWELVRLAWNSYKPPTDSTKFMNCPRCGSTAYAGCSHVELSVEGKNLLTANVKYNTLSPTDKFEVAWTLAKERGDVSAQVTLKHVLKIVENYAHGPKPNPGESGE